MTLRKTIQSVFDVFRSVLTSAMNNRVIYKISSIDQASQTVIFHVTNKRIFIKKTFAEIIADRSIIAGLSCEQACWLGVYYGRAMRNALKGGVSLRKISKPTYLLQHQYGRYRITGENRDGSINCLHIKTKKELTTSPILVAKDTLFIQYFDQTQACYIGILAGIALEKEQDVTQLVDNKAAAKVPYLQLVK